MDTVQHPIHMTQSIFAHCLAETLFLQRRSKKKLNWISKEIGTEPQSMLEPNGRLWKVLLARSHEMWETRFMEKKNTGIKSRRIYQKPHKAAKTKYHEAPGLDTHSCRARVDHG